MNDYELIAKRITEHIFEFHNVFFVESGTDMDSAEAIDIEGARGGIRYKVNHSSISSLEIVLTVADLYRITTTVLEKPNENVIGIKTKKPIQVVGYTRTLDGVMAYDLYHALEDLWYSDTSNVRHYSHDKQP